MSQSTSQSPSQNSDDDGFEPGEFRQTALYHNWYQRVASGNPNDYTILITAHPGYTSTSGAGKTTLSAWLARQLHINGMAGDWSAQQHYTLDVEQFAYEVLPRADAGSAILGDEMQGTVANTNFNKMRTQKTEQLRALAAIAGDRKNRTTKILVFQTLKRINSYLLDYVDSWLLIVDDSNYVANHYKVLPENVFDLDGSGGIKTPRVESLTWPQLPADDPEYRRMERLKEQANRGEGEFIEDSDEGEADKTIPQSVRNKKIIELHKSGVPQTKLADAFDLSQPRITQIVE
jgi:hypothetical protein